MNYQAMSFWWMVGLTLFNASIGLYLFWERHNNATSSRIKSLEDCLESGLSDHGKQISTLNEHIRHTPTHNDLAKLYERMGGTEQRLSERIDVVGGAVKRIEGENAAQTRILNLVYQSLVTK
jgi:hypothetical protein